VLRKSELEAKHELNLPWQACSCARGGGVVIVIVEIVGGSDLTQISFGA
jgi:hypothetical protein